MSDDLVGLYRETMSRIVALVSDDVADVAVPACPGWSVRDVLAHLTGVAQEWVSGNLAVPPSDAETAAQVARFSGLSVGDILKSWDEVFVELAAAVEAGTPLRIGDVVVHEHDIRAALGRPGARDSAALHCVSDRLLRELSTPVPLRVLVDDGEYRCGPDGECVITLRTTRFEAVRWRTGRRSRRQMAAMDWSGDPAPVLEHLFMFGPADADIVE